MLSDPPFMPQKGQPAFHLRETTVEELKQFRRMLAKAEDSARENLKPLKETEK